MKYTLTKTDGLKIAKGAAIAAGGALLTYLAQIIGDIDFGQYTGVIVALSSIIINVANRYLTDTR